MFSIYVQHHALMFRTEGPRRALLIYDFTIGQCKYHKHVRVTFQRVKIKAIDNLLLLIILTQIA